MSQLRTLSAPRLAAVTVVASALVAYWPVVIRLIHDWSTDDNYSHGFFIVPLAAYFAWERRERLVRLPLTPSWLGLPVCLAALLGLVAGTLGAEYFVARASLLLYGVGALGFLAGWAVVQALLFPIAFLLLMVPLPAIVFNQIAFPLQLLASRFGTSVMELASVPVLRQGNVITLANTTLEVAEACSGIRSLISLLTLGIVYGYFAERRTWVRVLVALATIPIAILTNGLRVAGTGILAHYYGPETAQGFFHTFSGWIVFVTAFLLLFLTLFLLQRFVPDSIGQRSESRTA